MKRNAAIRWIVLTAFFSAATAGVLSFRPNAQSEFMRGNRMPYDAFDQLPKTDIEVPGGVIHVGFAPGDIALPQEKVLDWIKTSARAITTYYGGFPVNSLRLLMLPVNGPRVLGGTTWGYRGASNRVLRGRDASYAQLRRV